VPQDVIVTAKVIGTTPNLRCNQSATAPAFCSASAKSFQDFDAVATRQHPIEHGRIGSALRGLYKLAALPAADGIGSLALVFDYQNAHHWWRL